jgi:hypothetical protein
LPDDFLVPTKTTSLAMSLLDDADDENLTSKPSLLSSSTFSLRSSDEIVDSNDEKEDQQQSFVNVEIRSTDKVPPTSTNSEQSSHNQTIVNNRNSNNDDDRKIEKNVLLDGNPKDADFSTNEQPIIQPSIQQQKQNQPQQQRQQRQRQQTQPQQQQKQQQQKQQQQQQQQQQPQQPRQQQIQIEQDKHNQRQQQQNRQTTQQLSSNINDQKVKSKTTTANTPSTTSSISLITRHNHRKPPLPKFSLRRSTNRRQSNNDAGRVVRRKPALPVFNNLNRSSLASSSLLLMSVVRSPSPPSPACANHKPAVPRFDSMADDDVHRSRAQPSVEQKLAALDEHRRRYAQLQQALSDSNHCVVDVSGGDVSSSSRSHRALVAAHLRSRSKRALANDEPRANHSPSHTTTSSIVLSRDDLQSKYAELMHDMERRSQRLYRMIANMQLPSRAAQRRTELAAAKCHKAADINATLLAALLTDTNQH